jgi:hypothetical protein
MPDGEDPMYDHPFFVKGMVWANNKLLEKNAATPPPQRQPLTDEEIEKVRHLIDWTAGWSYIEFARAIERAHRIGGGE